MSDSSRSNSDRQAAFKCRLRQTIENRAQSSTIDFALELDNDIVQHDLDTGLRNRTALVESDSA
jgi:hypothetical protein